jgi:RHS repeat-associated protein
MCTSTVGRRLSENSSNQSQSYQGNLSRMLGSLRQVGQTSWTILDTLTFDSYGNILSETNSANGDRFKFTGREWGSEIALQFSRARYYDPVTGRWTSRDPSGFAAADPNLYRYVVNIPNLATDPSGQCPLGWPLVYFIGAAIAALASTGCGNPAPPAPPPGIPPDGVPYNVPPGATVIKGSGKGIAQPRLPEGGPGLPGGGGIGGGGGGLGGGGTGLGGGGPSPPGTMGNLKSGAGYEGQGISGAGGAFPGPTINKPPVKKN